MIPKQGEGIFARLGKPVGPPVRFSWMKEWNRDMKTKLGSVILSSLLFAQGMLGFAAVAAVLMKEPAKQYVAAQSAALESLVSVR
jgi:hypothetical protein